MREVDDVVGYVAMFIALCIGAFILWSAANKARGAELVRWKPEYAQMDPSLRNWFSNQRAPKSRVPCCSQADGTKAAEDMRYNEKGERHYWAKFVIVGNEGGEEYSRDVDWMEVPDEAVIEDGPNPTGQPVVWWALQDGKLFIRCYKPGPKA